MANVQRITDAMAEVISKTAQECLGSDDTFDFDVGLMPFSETESEDGEQSFEMGAWVIFRLNCPESESRSVVGLTAPLHVMSSEGLRGVVESTISEMQFNRIVASYEPESTE